MKHPDPSVQRLQRIWGENSSVEPTRLGLAVIGLIIGALLLPLSIILWRAALS